jgi:tetratricopeptide (TPR) repeat protein
MAREGPPSPEEPDEADHARVAIANTCGVIGRTWLNQGNAATARGYYAEEVKWRESVGERVANELETRREQAGLYETLGDLDLQLGDPRAARAGFEKSLRLRESLRTEYPEDTQVARDLLLSYQKLGELCLLRWSDPAAARHWYERALAEFEHRLKDDPDNAVAKGDVARTHYGVATSALRTGDRAAAAEHYRACLALFAELDRIEKSVASAINHMTALARCGEDAEAARIGDRLAAGRPDANIDYALACGYALCAGAAARRGDSGDARARVRRHADAAVAALRDAMRQGWNDPGLLRVDPDIDPIRDAPAFKDLLRELEHLEAKAGDLPAAK